MDDTVVFDLAESKTQTGGYVLSFVKDGTEYGLCLNTNLVCGETMNPLGFAPRSQYPDGYFPGFLKFYDIPLPTPVPPTPTPTPALPVENRDHATTIFLVSLAGLALFVLILSAIKKPKGDVLFKGYNQPPPDPEQPYKHSS